MTAILGISAFYHDAAAALVVDGKIIAAAQEERFTRQKHDSSFPQQAIAYCLQEAGLTAAELDHVVFYEKPLAKFERLLESYLAYAPAGYRSFRQAIPKWLTQRLDIEREIRQGLSGFKRRIAFLDHHQSHAASAFFPSPFDEAAIVTVDGVGEWSTSCVGYGSGNKLQLLKETRFPHSLGLLYSAFTYYTGFRVNSGEYKLMGLAPYGQPVYKDLILTHLIDLKVDGSLRMDMQYFNYCQGLTMTSAKFHRLFGGLPKKPDSPISPREMNLAASIQAVVEEVLLRKSEFAKQLTGSKNLVLAGGVALNCVANGRLVRQGNFDNVWIQPAAGDAGGALGAALFVWHQLLERPRTAALRDRQQGSLLGPSYSDAVVRDFLDEAAAVYHVVESPADLCRRVANLVASGKVVGWFQGRMEFGPRALGARSILADARNPNMQSTLNLKTKFRESFRPFAPIVLQQHASEYFEFTEGQSSPYMMLTTQVKPEKRIATTDEAASGLEKLQSVRSVIPAVTHVDYSARVQTVDAHSHPLLQQLLSQFHKLTGCPVMINTSFNVRGEPLVCTPHDAYRCFLMTGIDALVIGSSVVLKSEQPQLPNAESTTAYRSSFIAD